MTDNNIHVLEYICPYLVATWRNHIVPVVLLEEHNWL